MRWAQGGIGEGAIPATDKILLPAKSSLCGKTLNLRKAGRYCHPAAIIAGNLIVGARGDGEYRGRQGGGPFFMLPA
jgi:hypothetical protein